MLHLYHVECQQCGSPYIHGLLWVEHETKKWTTQKLRNLFV